MKGKNLKTEQNSGNDKVTFGRGENTTEGTGIKLDFSQYAFFRGFDLINVLYNYNTIKFKI